MLLGSSDAHRSHSACLSSLEQLRESLFLIDTLVLINMLNDVLDGFMVVMERHPVNASVPCQLMDVLEVCPVNAVMLLLLEEALIIFNFVYLLD